MKVVWVGTSGYRAFAELSRGMVSVISSRVSDQARGMTLDGVLLLVTDATSQFSDLELRLDAAHQTDTHVELGEASLVEEDVESEVAESGRVLWRYDGEARVLRVFFGDGPVVRWGTLDGGLVILGLGADDRLRAGTSLPRRGPG